jgi:anti-sigma B factor antagonist
MNPEPLVIEESAGAKEGERVLRLIGPILLNNLFDFQARVRADTSKILVLEFSQVPYIDSAGIGALMGAYVSRQKDTGRSLLLVGVNQRVRSALQVTHVEQFFQFADALAS